MSTVALSACDRSLDVEAAFDGRLDPAAQTAAMNHARGCSSCEAHLASLRSLRETTSSLPEVALDIAEVQRVRAQVIAAASRARPSTPWVARAVMVAAVLALAFVGLRLSRRPSPAVARAPIARAVGVDLAGAGTLRPDPGAVFRVERAGPDTRVALTSGTIHLAVVHRRPTERFVIALTDAEVEVRGTRFAVEADEGHLRRVRVTEGLVAVRYAGAPERLVAAGDSWELPSAPVAEPSTVVAPTVVTPRSELSRTPAPSPASRDFRAGALAYLQGDPAAAAAALRRFLAASPAHDARREDARYVLVLALDATHDASMERSARDYLSEFPRGVRRAEVTVRLTARLARRGACDAAAAVALGMPENAEASLRAQAAQALSRCAGSGSD